MAATLTDFVQQKYDGYVELIEQLKAELSKIRDEQKQTYARYENTLKEAMELDKAIAATRQEMSNSNNMPADIETLAEQLRQQLIERRHLAASLADLAQSVKFVDKNVSVEESLLVELTSTTSLWETDLEDATGLQQHQDNWVSSETEDAISAVRDIATALLALDDNAVKTVFSLLSSSSLESAATSASSADDSAATSAALSLVLISVSISIDES